MGVEGGRDERSSGVPTTGFRLTHGHPKCHLKVESRCKRAISRAKLGVRRRYACPNVESRRVVASTMAQQNGTLPILREGGGIPCAEQGSVAKCRPLDVRLSPKMGIQERLFAPISGQERLSMPFLSVRSTEKTRVAPCFCRLSALQPIERTVQGRVGVGKIDEEAARTSNWIENVAIGPVLCTRAAIRRHY